MERMDGTKAGTPAYPYGNMTQLKELLDKNKIPLHRLVLENEKAIMGTGEEEIYRRLDLILEAKWLPCGED